MRLKKVLVSTMILSFAFGSNVFAANYDLTNTKLIDTTQKVIIPDDQQKGLTDLIINGTFLNDEEHFYGDNYGFLTENKDINFSTNDYRKNYTFDIKSSVKSGNLANGDLMYDMSFKTKASFIKYNIDVDNLSTNPQYNDDVKKYLLPSDKVESNDPNIIQKSKEIVGSETNPYKKAKLIYDYTYMYITYDTTQGNFSALHALQTGFGVCEDYADLMVALLRAQDIPARTVSGYKLDSNLEKINLSSNLYNHMWVEFYLDGYGWVPADPTIIFTINGLKSKTDMTFAQLNGNYYIPLTIDAPLQVGFHYALKPSYSSLRIMPTIESLAVVKNYDAVSVNKPSITLFLNSKKAYNNEGTFNLNASPYLKNGRTMVPLRFISENLKTNVGWDNTKNQVTIKNDDKTIVLTIGEKVAYVNGKVITLEASPEVVNDSTMVPIRFVSENLNASVTWNNNSQSLLITQN